MTMKTPRYILLLCLVTGLLASCYEDKGNYDYRNDIYDISVKLKSIYGLRKSNEKMTYSITPEITTHDGDTSYLDFVWLMYNEATGVEDTVGTSATATIVIDPNAPGFSYNYSLQLYVTDRRTGGLTMVPTTLEIAKPYAYSWIVLHETDGHAELGTVEYVGADTVVTRTAYTSEQGKSFTGKPLNMEVVKNSVGSGWNYSSVSQVFVTTTNPTESGLLNQLDHFKLMASWNNLLAAEQRSDIDFADMQLSSGDGELLFVSKGKAYRNNYQSAVCFRVNPSATFDGAYYIDRCSSGPNSGIGYDKEGHRFVSMTYSNNWSGYNVSSVVSAGTFSVVSNTSGNAADPGLISPDEQVIRFIPGYRYSLANPAAWLNYSVYAYSLGPDNRSHVYVFRYHPMVVEAAAYGATMPYRFTFATPAGITAETPMTSGYEYNNILFYAVGNKICKLDFVTGESTVIYSHEDPSAQITSLRMAVEGYTDAASDFTGTATYGHPYCRCLGAGVNTGDGKGELVVLQLNTQGKVDEDHKHPSIQLYKGFGKIKDINFM